jgi:RecB family exonuclease
LPDTLHLHLGPALDGGTPWRHGLDDGRARAGWQVTGPLGFAGRIARLYGVPLAEIAEPIRAAWFAARLERHDTGERSYSASRRHDAFGVARHLLELRDGLRLAGWDGRSPGGSRRLVDLAAIEALDDDPLPPGLPDVLAELTRAVSARDALPARLVVTLRAPRDHLPLRLRDLLDALAAKGADVTLAPPPGRADDASDLGRLQRALAVSSSVTPTLTGDGSVVVLEAETPWQAGEVLAAWIRDHDGRRTLLVPTEASILNACCVRAGLPELGLASRSRWRPALQVLPLRLALAFRPRDPEDAFRLLTLPGGPLGGSIRRALTRALTEMPGVGGPDWRAAAAACGARQAERVRVEALEAGLSNTIAERMGENAAAEVLAHIDGWFGGTAWDPREGVPARVAAEICEEVARWARGRARAGRPEDRGAAPDPLLLQAASVATALRRMLLTTPDARIPRSQLEELHDGAVGSGSEWGSRPGASGRPALCTHPGAVLEGADEVVWWGFVADAEPAVPPSPWTGPERRALAAVGVDVDPPGALRAREAWAWRQPVLAAGKRLVLVRWRLSGREPTADHPFHDEMASRLGSGLEGCRVLAERVLATSDRGTKFAAGERWLPLRIARTAAPSLAPRALWHLPGPALAPTPPLSATQIESLFSCPLRWVLGSVIRLRPGARSRIPDGDRLVGLFAHRVLQDVLLDWEAREPVTPLPAEEARRLAGQAFDARIEGEAAPLLRGGREVDHDRARRTVVDAAGALAQLLADGGWRPESAERTISGTFAGPPFEGSIDLVVRRADGQAGILDLKLGSGRNRRDQMAKGRSLQLALYARGLGAEHGSLAPTGYVVLGEGRLLTTSDMFPGATRVEGPAAEAVLADAEHTFEAWRRSLTEGAVLARGPELLGGAQRFSQLTGEKPPDGPDAPCQWCDFRTLCTFRIGPNGE